MRHRGVPGAMQAHVGRTAGTAIAGLRIARTRAGRARAVGFVASGVKMTPKGYFSHENIILMCRS